MSTAKRLREAAAKRDEAFVELARSRANEARLREALFVTFAWIRQCIPVKYLGEAWADIENRVKRVLEETKP